MMLVKSCSASGVFWHWMESAYERKICPENTHTKEELEDEIGEGVDADFLSLWFPILDAITVGCPLRETDSESPLYRLSRALNQCLPCLSVIRRAPAACQIGPLIKSHS